MTYDEETVSASSDIRAPHRATGEVVALYGQEEARELYDKFQEYNARFFDGRLAPPLVLITLVSPNAYGDYSPRDVHGLESRIRITPAVVRRGYRFRQDVLLHEMIHAWQHEIDHDLERGYRGHGPGFAAQCNRIGAVLGLPPVGVKGRKGLPDCASWPLNVRPAGYYPNAWTKPRRAPHPSKKPGPAREIDPAVVYARLLAALKTFDGAMLEMLAAAIAQELAARTR